MSRLYPLVVAASVALSAGGAKAHEFWIEPETYAVAPGDAIVAAIRVGQKFDGSSYAYIPRNFRRFDLELGGEIAPVAGRAGDRPAVNMTAEGEGLAILVHVTRDYDLVYDSYEKFSEFVTSKDAAWALDAHAERGFPKEAPTEVYSRYGKSLVAVGDGAGEDHAFGLLTEIVALENPYTDDMDDGLDIQVFYQDAPRPDAFVEIFAKDAAGQVEVTNVTTDADGKATIPVTPGHAYLVDSVVLREPRPSAVGAQWESLWASLTFAVPD